MSINSVSPISFKGGQAKYSTKTPIWVASYEELAAVNNDAVRLSNQGIPKISGRALSDALPGGFNTKHYMTPECKATFDKFFKPFGINADCTLGDLRASLARGYKDFGKLLDVNTDNSNLAILRRSLSEGYNNSLKSLVGFLKKVHP